MTQKIGSVPQWYLGADCLATDSILYPRSIAGWDGDDVTAADVGDVLYAVLMNKDKNKMELLELDATDLATYDTTGLAIVKRGLPFFVDGSATDLVEVAANKLNWAVGDILLVGSHPPVLFRLAMKFLNGGEFDADYDFTGQVTFDSAKYPEIDDASVAPVDDEDLATKKYVDDVASGAGISYNRIVVEGNAGENVAAGQLVYFDETDNEWKLTDASVAGTSEQVKLGIAQGTGTNGNPIAGGVLVDGMDANQSGLVAGDLMYLSDTAGAIATSAGTVSVEVGYAHDATHLLFAPRLKKYLTTDQQAALAGSSGTPSSTNKYITANDVVEANMASKIPRRDSNGDVLVAATPTNANAAAPKKYIEDQIALLPRCIDINLTEVASTTSGEKTVYTYTMPANTMGANDFIEGVIQFSDMRFDSSAAVTVDLKLGGTDLVNATNTGGTGSATGAMTIRFRIYNNNSTSAQIAVLEFYRSPEAALSYYYNSYYGTGTKDTTTELAVALTVQASSGNTLFTKKAATIILFNK